MFLPITLFIKISYPYKFKRNIIAHTNKRNRRNCQCVMKHYSLWWWWKQRVTKNCFQKLWSHELLSKAEALIIFSLATIMPVSKSRYFPFEKSNAFPLASVTIPPASA